MLGLTPLPVGGEEGGRDDPRVIIWLVAGRTLTSIGAVGMTIPVMLSEVTPKELRGRLMLGAAPGTGSMLLPTLHWCHLSC